MLADIWNHLFVDGLGYYVAFHQAGGHMLNTDAIAAWVDTKFASKPDATD